MKSSRYERGVRSVNESYSARNTVAREIVMNPMNWSLAV